MPKTRRDRSVSYESSRLSPLPCSSRHTKQSSSSCPASKEAMKEWEEARCPVCMEHPHNAVLLICSSYEKGCRPYMCDTSYRHSNCFDQFCKSFAETPTSTALQEAAMHLEESTPVSAITSATSTGDLQLESAIEERNKGPIVAIDLPNMRKLHEKLPCPLCRGQIWGCTVMEPARCFMNNKTRSCASEKCEFSGNYTDQRKHARSEHPLVRPSDADPERQRSWRRLERQRDIGDVLSTIQSSFGDDDNTILPIEESSLLTVFLLIRVFRPGSSSRSSSWSGTSRPRARFGIRTRPIRLWGENDDEETASSSRVMDQDEVLYRSAVENDGEDAGDPFRDGHESSGEDPAVWGRRVRRRATRSTPDDQLRVYSTTVSICLRACLVQLWVASFEN